MPRLKATESDDPTFHRSNLKKLFTYMKRYNKRGGVNYENFIKKLFEIFTDNPPISWRFIITSYKFPGFRVVNRKTGRTTYFLRVTELGLIINSTFFKEEYRHLFPQEKGFYGAGDCVTIEYPKFGIKKQQLYHDAIRAMVTESDKVSINFDAYK